MAPLSISVGQSSRWSLQHQLLGNLFICWAWYFSVAAVNVCYGTAFRNYLHRIMSTILIKELQMFRDVRGPGKSVQLWHWDNVKLDFLHIKNKLYDDIFNTQSFLTEHWESILPGYLFDDIEWNLVTHSRKVSNCLCNEVITAMALEKRKNINVPDIKNEASMPSQVFLQRTIVEKRH